MPIVEILYKKCIILVDTMIIVQDWGKINHSSFFWNNQIQKYPFNYERYAMTKYRKIPLIMGGAQCCEHSGSGKPHV